jgi:hypothetical protein
MLPTTTTSKGDAKVHINPLKILAQIPKNGHFICPLFGLDIKNA